MADLQFEVNEQQFTVAVQAADDAYTVRIGAQTYHVQAARGADGQLNLVIDGVHHQLFVAEVGNAPAGARVVWFNGQAWTLTRADTRQRRRTGGAAAQENVLTAAMPGQVRELLVAAGDGVAAGAPLLLLEAMKMEMRITAPAAGTVTAILCAVGDVVERGQPLIEIDYSDIEAK